ncbi:MAG TPA: MMPL family transporter [Opitutaceae bacterium]|nr:MMPL family transporter [Opitutaceae bacterium]
MTPSRQKIFARAVLLAAAALGFIWLAHLDYSKKISTDVLDLIPAAERAPELALVRSLAGERSARIVLCAVRGAGDPTAAARTFVAALKNSPAIADAVALSDPAMRNALGRALFEQRLQLLLPSWLAAQQRAFAATGRPPGEFSSWLAENVAQSLDPFLARPESAAFQDLLPSDPLLLVPGFIAKIKFLAASGPSASNTALVWVEIRASPFSEAGQAPVFTALEAALAAVRVHEPAATLAWTGINRFAADSKKKIEREISTLNLLSLAAVLTVAALLVRRAWRLLNLLPVVLLAMLGAWCATTLAFARLHILVFVVGSLLTGIAIDYGFYIYMQPPTRPGEPYADKLRRLLRPLLSSCFTTVAGFTMLLASDLPLIRQLGVFVGAGLLSALAAALLYFAQSDGPHLEAHVLRALRPRGAQWPKLLLLAAFAIALAGPWLLHWRDDIRELEISAPALAQNDGEVRALFGESDDSTVYLTQGATTADARAALEKFFAWHEANFPTAAAASLGLALPPADDWQALPARLGELKMFSADLRAALRRAGYDPAQFAPFFSAWENFRTQPLTGYDALAAALSAPLTGPLSLLMHTDGHTCWFLTIARHADTGPEPPAALATTSLNQLQSFNHLFTRYRSSALHLSLAGLALVIAGVFATYGWRRGLRIALIPAGSCFFVLGALGLCGQTLNLFHLLGAFLGVCIAHNYAIFSADAPGDTPPPSIRLSAASALASFGVLAFSRIPVVSALGLTVALIVLTALIVIELEPLTRPRHADDPT